MSTKPTEEILYNDQVTDIYDFWVGNGYYDYPMLSKEVAETAKKNDRILEIGIGTGNAAIPLAKLGYKIDGIDQSPFMLQRLEDKLTSERFYIQTWQQSVEKIDLPHKYDLIFSVGGPFWLAMIDSRLFMHSYVNMQALPVVFKKLNALLKPGGCLMINVQQHGTEFKNRLGNGMEYKFTIQQQPDGYILKTHCFYKDGALAIKQPYKMLQLKGDKVKALLKEAGFSTPQLSNGGTFWVIKKKA